MRQFSKNLVSVSAVVVPPRIQLNDGNYLPMIGFGTAPDTSPRGTPDSAVRQAVTWALEAGYRHIDTAYAYAIEPEVGLGVSDCISRGVVTRGDVFITTKLWSDRHERKRVIPALKKSLQNLKTDYVDLYLMHFPVSCATTGGPDDIDYLEAWQGMEDARSQGLVKSIGVANFNITQLTRLLNNCKVKPAVLQVEVSPTLPNTDLVNFSKYHNITVIAHSPFGYTVPRPKKPGTTPAPPARKLDDCALVDIARKHGKTPAQVVLRYLVERGTFPIPKSITKSHINDNIDIFDFYLTEDEVKTVEGFDTHQRVWDHIWWRNFWNYPFIPY